MYNHKLNKEIFESIFKDHAISGRAILRASKTKGVNFDKFRNTGYEKNHQNPLFFKCLTKAVTANSLVIRELGLTESGAIQIIVKDNDEKLLKLSEKIIIDNIEYTAFNHALGNRFQSFKLPFDYHKIILFRLVK